MAWFRRKKSDAAPMAESGAALDPSVPERAFWSWWCAEGATAVAHAIDARDVHGIVDLLSGPVEAMHRELHWELGPGEAGSQHVLVVSAGHDPRLRAIARRWLLAAPAADEVFCYSDGRIAQTRATEPTAAIGVQPAERTERIEHLTVSNDAPVAPDATDPAIDLEQVVIGATARGARVDLELYHPGLLGLDRAGRRRVTAELLTAALGESAADTWIGDVDHVETAPERPTSVEELRELVERVAAKHPLSGPNRVWTVTRGVDLNGEYFVRHMEPLVAAGRPDLDTHVRLVVPYAAASGGFYDVRQAGLLGELETSLEDGLGETGQLVASENRPGRRVLHFYVDGTTAASAVLQKDLDSWAEGPIVCDVAFDPAWEAVGHLR
ncbi:MAG TPA: hypothetical protein P5181_09605 [Dermatophilaceae bacterium]|nr:hypothetical protein [Dermatophilaceae bacterium]